MSTAINSMSTAGTEVGKLAAYINKMLESNDDQINRIVNKTEQTLDSFQRALSQRRRRDRQRRGPREPEARRSPSCPQLLTDTRSAVNTITTTVESRSIATCATWRA